LHIASEIIDAAHKMNWSVNVRSQSSIDTADIYLLDTMGELPAAYQFCDTAFIGGTLKIGAGHNVVEPLVFGKPVSYGPNRGFFESVQIACEEAGVGFRVRTPQELASHWVTVLTDTQISDQIQSRASQLLMKERSALEINIDVLMQQLTED